MERTKMIEIQTYYLGVSCDDSFETVYKYYVIIPHSFLRYVYIYVYAVVNIMS